VSPHSDSREVEWQFDALDLRAVSRWLNDPGGPGKDDVRIVADARRTHTDEYYDTNDRRFHRAGYLLRVRTGSRRREATLKSLDSAGPTYSGVRSRRELTEVLERGTRSPLQGDGPVGMRARAVVGRKRLLRLFEVRTRRSVFVAERDGVVPSAEIALDETTIRPADGSPPARLRRVEIELPALALSIFEPFVESLRAACALQPAVLTKYEAGMLSADLRPPQAERFGSTEIDGAMAIGTVALAVLRQHFTELRAREPGARLGDDPEELHHMRVASRRLRAALALFTDVLPTEAVEVGDELRWVGECLGAVRDLDVQLAELDARIAAFPHADREPLAPLRDVLASQRDTARGAMLEALDSRRYGSLVNRYGRILRARRRGPEGPAGAPAFTVAPELIEERIRRLRRRAERITKVSASADYHRVRLQCKRLRYALEFFSDLYPTTSKSALKRLVTLQDLLGRHQDADIAIQRLRALAGEHSDELPSTTIFAMGELAQRYRQEMAALRARFPDARAGLAGKPWKALRRELSGPGRISR
jgi:CHAD domain-containing protein